MELEFISTQPVYTGKPTISFSKTGLVSISKAAAEKIGIKENDSIAIAIDKQQPEDWYLVHNPDKEGITLRKSRSFNFHCNSRSYSMEFMKTFSVTERTVRVPLSTHGLQVGDGPARAYAIITKAVNPTK